MNKVFLLKVLTISAAFYAGGFVITSLYSTFGINFMYGLLFGAGALALTLKVYCAAKQ